MNFERFLRSSSRTTEQYQDLPVALSVIQYQPTILHNILVIDSVSKETENKPKRHESTNP